MYYSQIGQDKFVAETLNFKRKGIFLDVGCHHYKDISNTYYLETELEWTGIGIDLECKFKDEWELNRKSKFICDDALKIDYNMLLKNNNIPKTIDYLSLDLEPPIITFNALEKILETDYIFNIITFETDHYRKTLGWNPEPVQELSRNLLTSKGYILIKDINDQEDFYINNLFLSK